MNNYIVTVIPKRPAFGERGAQLEISAPNKAKAISIARKRVPHECLYDRHDGPLVYTATLAD